MLSLLYRGRRGRGWSQYWLVITLLLCNNKLPWQHSFGNSLLWTIFSGELKGIIFWDIAFDEVSFLEGNLLWWQFCVEVIFFTVTYERGYFIGGQFLKQLFSGCSFPRRIFSVGGYLDYMGWECETFKNFFRTYYLYIWKPSSLFFILICNFKGFIFAIFYTETRIFIMSYIILVPITVLNLELG